MSERRSLGVVKKVQSIFLEKLVFEGAFEVIMLHFMEPIHIELPDEAIHFFVSEISG